MLRVHEFRLNGLWYVCGILRFCIAGFSRFWEVPGIDMQYVVDWELLPERLWLTISPVRIENAHRIRTWEMGGLTMGRVYTTSGYPFFHVASHRVRKIVPGRILRHGFVFYAKLEY